MAARDWLKGLSDEVRQAHAHALTGIVAIPGLDDPTTRALLARSWGKVARDLAAAGEEPSHDDMLRHVGGDMFMDALAADGDAMLVSRRLAGVEEGSDEWESMSGDLAKFRRVDVRLRELSSACEALRRTMVPVHEAMGVRA